MEQRKYTDGTTDLQLDWDENGVYIELKYKEDDDTLKIHLTGVDAEDLADDLLVQSCYVGK